MSGDLEIWTEFFEDDRMRVLTEGYAVRNHPDGTWTKENPMTKRIQSVNLTFGAIPEEGASKKDIKKFVKDLRDNDFEFTLMVLHKGKEVAELLLDGGLVAAEIVLED